jgi:ABC-type dipeptide/oligopeptide/nickel transport system permease component
MIALRGQDVTPEQIAELRHEMGLDRPFLVQYVRYIWNAAQGDLGRSIRGRTSVLEEILARLPSTLELVVAGVVWASIVGIGLGVVAGTARKKIVDKLATLIALFGVSVPSFWIAMVLIVIFGMMLRWVVVVGEGGLKDLILPAFCIGLRPMAELARLTRTCLLEVMRDDYVRTARAKGLAHRVVMMRHVMPNAMIPVVTMLGLQFASLMGGTVFVESVFARPGLGRFVVTAIAYRDYPQVQGIVLFAALIFVLTNLIVDLIYGLLDPRIRVY